LFTSGLLLSLASFSVAFAQDTEEKTPEAEIDRPIVRVITPGAVVGSRDATLGGAAFLMGQWAGTRILVALEIVDVTGAGISMTDSGDPRFFETNKNVDIFASNIEEMGTYVDGQGRSVLQIISKVPIENLKAGDRYLTPPMDKNSIPPHLRKRAFTIPMRAMLEAVDFVFIVEDRNGVRSKPSRLVVAHSNDYYRGPFNVVEDQPETTNPSKE
jgi:hypothetical protein